MYRLNRNVEADEEPPPLSHSSLPRAPIKHFASNSPHVLSLPPSTQGSFAIDSTAQQPAKLSRPSHSGVICLTLTGAVLALLFFLLAALAPTRLVHVVLSTASSALLLSSYSSPSYAAFVSNADNPLLLSVYLYNVTNAADMLNNTAPAALDEIGPFVFTDTRRKLNPTFNSTTPATLTYLDWQTLTFVPEKSCGRCQLEANITTANLLTQGAYHAALTQQLMSNSTFLLVEFNFYWLEFKSAGLLPFFFTTRTVYDVLFGYSAPVGPAIFVPGYFSNQSLADTLTSNLQSTIRTGVDDPLTAHEYVRWQNQSGLYTCSPSSNAPPCAWNTTVWATTTASTVRGSDGMIFTDVNGISAASSPLLFFYPFRRSIALEYTNTSSYSGLSTLDFSFPSSFFRSSAVHPDNSDYYQYLDGAVNLTSTASFIPLFATPPHLINVDTTSPHYPHNLIIANSQPNPSTANTFSIHPTSGVLAHVSTSFQLNVLLQPINYTIDLSDGQPDTIVLGSELTTGLLPLFYATEEGGLSEQELTQLLRLDEVEEALQWSPYGLWPAGAVCAVAALCGTVWLWRTRGAENAEREGGKEEDNIDGRGDAAVGVRFDEKSRLRTATGTYGWYGQEQTEQDIDDDDGV